MKGRPFETAYIASPMEAYERDMSRFWLSEISFGNMTSRQAAASAVAALRRVAPTARNIGIESSFLPLDAYEVLRDGLPDARYMPATLPLELLRAVKTPAELQLLEQASVPGGRGHEGPRSGRMARAPVRPRSCRPCGARKPRVDWGSTIASSPWDNPSTVLPPVSAGRRNEVMSLDSGGNLGGYIGDLCRMAILGEPDAELEGPAR